MHSYLHAFVGHGGHAGNGRFADLPHHCPACSHHVHPWRIGARSTRPDDMAVDFAMQCPRAECRRLFIVAYVMGTDGEFELAAYAAEPWQREAAAAV
jgi:hypothetical protein